MSKALGKKGEALSERILSQNGYVIEQTNYTNRYGEIDIIAKDAETICFVEVKTRMDDDFGEGFEAVTPFKQHKLIQAAQVYLMENDLEDVDARFDVVAVLGNPDHEAEVEIIKNAFELPPNKC